MRKLFGTFGIRRVANEVLTPEMATKLALSFGTFISGEKRSGSRQRCSKT